jgi:hypothetical protein
MTDVRQMWRLTGSLPIMTTDGTVEAEKNDLLVLTHSGEVLVFPQPDFQGDMQ